MKKFWKRWQSVTKKIAQFEAEIILYLIFGIVIIPLGLIMQLFFRKNLSGHASNRRVKTYWIAKKKTNHDLPFAHQQ